jgi:AraC-like DNA-binding protein/ligand-binding sensor protein
MGERYAKLAQYLEYLSNTYTISICIKDFCGFIPIDRDLDQTLQPYLAHTNPYCMYIKADKIQFFGCLNMMRPMFIRCAAGQPFYGVCHAGVGEYVIPIKVDNIVLGAITAGYVPCRPELSRYLIKRRSRVSANINYETACDLFNRYITPATIDTKQMRVLLEIVAEYLSTTYLHLKDIHSGDDLPARRSISHEDTIIAHALEYIRRNYASQIKVKDVAAHCYCSESYINHSFKKRVSMNVNTYINKVRIEHAKHRLLNTTDIMTSIALDTGFNDPNYFSRVFAKLVGRPPSQFRRLYS